MAETIGTLELKIARFQRQLQVIEQQLVLASIYSDHSQRLILKSSKLQLQLDQLLKRRQDLVAKTKPEEYVLS